MATELGIKLAQWGHEIHFISYDRPFRLDLFNENIFLHEVDIIDYPLFKFPPYSLALSGKIAEVAKTAPLDIIHVHYAIPHTTSAMLARLLIKNKKLPIVTTLHGTDITIVGNDKQFFDIVKFSLEVSDGVTAVSDSLKKETLDLFKVDREIKTIYNFVDPKEYKRIECPLLRSRYADANEKIIMHVSNFRPVKRLADVIEIFAGINQSVSAKLLLIGDGPERMTAQKQVEALGLKDRVLFLGKQDRIVELLSVADLFLLPSEKESFGLVALEAMACQVPVIASDIGGLPEVIDNGVTGFLAPLGDIDKMIQQGVEILQNPQLQRAMGNNAREQAMAKFHIDNVVKQYESYYKYLCSC